MKTSFLTAAFVFSVILTASTAMAQISTSTTANVRGNVSVGGEVERGVPAIDQKVDAIIDPVLDSKASGAVQTDAQRQKQHDRMKADIDTKGKLAPVEGNTTSPVLPSNPASINNFKQIDKDLNGQISRTEFESSTTAAPFATLDIDGNGSISPDEISTYNKSSVK